MSSSDLADLDLAHLDLSLLAPLGWHDGLTDAVASYAESGLRPGRVARPGRGAHLLATGGGSTVLAAPSTALLHSVVDDTALPTVGDWVLWHGGGDGPALIDVVLPRTSAFLRHAGATATRAQVLAANIDVLLVVVSLAVAPNLRRIERFLTLGWESGAQPVVLLTKADLCHDVDVDTRDVEGAAPGVPVHAMSAVTGEGLAALEAYLDGRSTLALIGASGVGKSTLVNRLTGAATMETSDVRSDGKGRHTTTHRELIELPQGGVLIDTPGLRGVQLWDAEEGLEQAFADVEVLAAQCRFPDCGHDTEPGCAVTAAIASGELPARRLDSYQRLQRELVYLENKQDARARAEARKKWRTVAKAQRAHRPRP
ncbi:MAG TPA: ribosome small subunit-dependent GTPase A [Mycobacteriales bacterium]|nr:ribosome small subunit-dependent GTPase A [Mycobacteriales bacterium]